MDEATATASLVSSPVGVMTTLVGVAAFFFWLEKATGWRLFKYFIPLLWIYAVPVVLRNTGVLPGGSPAYDLLRDYGLPVFIVLLLVGVDVGAAVRIMGRGVLVMLLGTAGVVVGGVVAYLIVHRWLSPVAWTGFGALAGSWIGGTGNLAAAAGALETPPEELGLAVLADNLVYVAWLPLLLGSKAFADRFNRWTGVPEGHVERMEEASRRESTTQRPIEMRDYLFLGVLAVASTWLATSVASWLPELGDVVSTSTWRVLLVTTCGILLSFTPARRIPGSHNLAMAIVYTFVAGMGARASLAGFGDAPAFVLGAFIWIAIHGAFCLLGARLFKVDVHTLAIASAANIGGAASAPVVAAHHRESLVPGAILMALLGYAIGNYLAIFTGQMCYYLTR